jgi:hypothetical protein
VKYWIAIGIVLLLTLGACKTAKDTANEANQGSKKAVGVAEKMKGGTVGSTDEDTGEAQNEGE